jgi:anti-anti-sigma factor
MKLTKVSEVGGVVCLQCEGEISPFRYPSDATSFEPLLGPRAFHLKVLVDLENTAFIDSSGISWLILTHKQFVKHGGMLVLHSIPPMIQQMLKLMKMELVLNLAADARTALARAEGKQP